MVEDVCDRDHGHGGEGGSCGGGECCGLVAGVMVVGICGGGRYSRGGDY